MNTFVGRIRSRLFCIKAEETTYVRRKFRGASLEMQGRLDRIGATFRDGYHIALECGRPETAEVRLVGVDAELQGFAYEGAAMGFALLDRLTPWRAGRVKEFLRGSGGSHAYMVHVGIGWVWARMPWGIQKQKGRLDPLLGWLAFDGWGFHEGFFHWRKYLAGRLNPVALSGYEHRAFDQGLGRSFWFANGGCVKLISGTIGLFPGHRHADLWSGVGLAATYAGIVSEEELVKLREAAGPFQAPLAQGAAFAAKARQRAGNLNDYNNLATNVLCRMSGPMAARVTDDALVDLPAGLDLPAYECWRRRIQDHFARAAQLLEA